MKILQPFLSLSGLAERAVAHAHKIVERWDVPHEVEVDGHVVPVPADLDDRTPRMWGLADGRRITSVLTLDELATGGPNPAIPLILALIPLSTLLLFFAPIWITAIVSSIALIFTWRVAGWKLTAVAEILSTLPFYGVMLHARYGIGTRVMTDPSPMGGYLSPPTSLFAGVPLVLGALAVGTLLTVAIGFAVVNFFSNNKYTQPNGQPQAKRSGLVHTGRSALLLVAVIVVSLFLARLSPVFAFFPMVILPAWYVRRERTAYLRQLAAMDNFFPGESLVKSNAHLEARKKQAQNAAQDRSPFIDLGVALGVLTEELDGYAPDGGLPVGLTIDDLAQHLLVVGTSGTGKTSGVLRPLIAQYVDAKAGGLLVLDGKGSLAAEMKGLPGYTCIDPSVALGLIEGLGPEDVTRALASVGAHFGKNKGNSSFFTSEASTMIFHAGVILEALVEAGVAGYAWTLHCWINLLINLNADPRKEGERLEGLLANFAPETDGNTLLLVDALTYVVSTIVSYSSETRSNIWATVQSWTSPIVQHVDLVRWAHTEHGIDISRIDTGGLFGISLPEVKFGKAGLLVQSLIKERVFNILRRRVTDPKPDQKKIAIVVDEAQELIGDADKAFLPVARGLGGIAVYASQSIDAFHARIGNKDEANAFLDTFSSQVILRSSDLSLKWIATRLGNTVRPSWKGNGSAIGYMASLDSLATASLSSTAHEGTSLYRSLRRQGAGQFRYGDMYGRDYGHIDDLHIQAMTTVEFQAKPLVTLDEADSKLAEPFVAIVQVQRGGVRRRDFVKLTPKFDFKTPGGDPASITA